jgi:hypothetical protein
MQVSANLKKLCMANPWYVVFPGLSPTKARNGSIETLMEASIIHSIPANKTGELSIINNAAEAKIAPAKSKVFV